MSDWVGEMTKLLSDFVTELLAESLTVLLGKWMNYCYDLAITA
jgi:hypothetical protein